MLKNKTSNICLVSSAGGHLAQLKQLIPLVEKQNFFIVTERNNASSSLKNMYTTYFLKQQERKNMNFLLSFSYNFFKSMFILLKERPKVIISTGAGAVLPLCLLGKLTGSKIVFIESFAKISTPTITGRLIYKFSDRFYIQWEELKEHYPKAVFRGTIY